MQTYKKRFRKKRNTKKRQNKKQVQNKKDPILKGVVCYKIRIIPSSNGGGLFDGPKFDRLEEMIIDLQTTSTYSQLQPFLNEVIDKKNVAKKQKIFNEIFKENYSLPSHFDPRDDPSEVAELIEHSKKVKSLLDYLNNGSKDNKPTKDDVDTLEKILLRKQKADKILTEILNKLDTEAVKKQLSPSQVASIKSKIEGTGGITSALTSVTSKISNGAVSLGNWLAPELVDDDGIKKKLQNRQSIKFLWYPRKHIDYKKGSTTPKRGYDDIEYGDFMVLIEPEEYASTGEFFRQTYHGVEDLLATLLMGCDGPFCLTGEVKRKPYNWREYVINNDQPTIDRDRRNPQLVEK